MTLEEAKRLKGYLFFMVALTLGAGLLLGMMAFAEIMPLTRVIAAIGAAVMLGFAGNQGRKIEWFFEETVTEIEQES